jgi:hypothetical protein
MADLLSIYNGALTELGSDLLSEPNENNSRQRALSAQWERVRKAELRAHGWKCALRRMLLPADVDVPPFEFARQFTLPADCLRVWRVGTPSDVPEFTVQGRKILTDAGAPLRVTIVTDLQDIGQWDSSLVDAVSFRLATATCRRITGAADLMAELERKYQRVVANARTMSAMEDYADTLEASEFLASRF